MKTAKLAITFLACINYTVLTQTNFKHIPQVKTETEELESTNQKNIDQEVIKALILKENNTYWSGEFEHFANCWADKGDIEWAYPVENGTLHYEGYDEFMAIVKDWISSREDQNMTEYLEFDWQDWKINIQDNLAIANVNVTTLNKSIDQTNLTRKLIVLEKMSGQWKFIQQYSMLMGNAQKE